MRLSVLLIAAITLMASVASAEVKTKVFLNGVPTPVYFNDGDSFRVLGGKLKGSKARLAGFNTLESYGPAHLWGTWTMDELSRYATLGTLNARRGTWRCTSNMEKDGYGRILWDCPQLQVDQVRKGLAHAMTVTKDPAAPELVKAQAEAIKERRGIWAHGVPPFVMTSLHSSTEGSSKGPYNRLISSADGHSESWQHTDAYRECQKVCQPADDADDSKVAAFIVDLREAADMKDALSGYTDDALTALVKAFVTDGSIRAGLQDESRRGIIELHVSRAAAAGRLTTSGRPVSCMVYVNYKRRYGPTRASCLQ